MNMIIIALCMVSVAMAAPGSGIKSRFSYMTPDGQTREENVYCQRVAGSYSYVDATGMRRTVQYTAGPEGYKATGDIGPDTTSANIAANMASVAAKALAPGTYVNINGNVARW